MDIICVPWTKKGNQSFGLHISRERQNIKLNGNRMTVRAHRVTYLRVYHRVRLPFFVKSYSLATSQKPRSVRRPRKRKALAQSFLPLANRFADSSLELHVINAFIVFIRVIYLPRPPRPSYWRTAPRCLPNTLAHNQRPPTA